MKRIYKLCILLALTSMLGGCSWKSGDDLLLAPQPTSDYSALQNELQKELSKGGVIYTSPESGENRSTVQLKDLDNDGEDEAIAFFRGSSQTTSNKFTIAVYKRIGDEYTKIGSVEGTGVAINSVEYPKFTEDGKLGIVVSWRLTTGDTSMGLTVCGFEDSDNIVPILETDYLSYKLYDMTGDIVQELITVSADSEGKKIASLYQYNGETMQSLGEASVTLEAKTIARITTGKLQNGKSAVFLESRPESGIGLMTDIFIYNEESGFSNIAPETGQTESYSTYRPVSVYADDADKDGIIEIPRALLMVGFEQQATDALYLLDWYAYGNSEPVLKVTTYNSQSEEWSFAVPDDYRENVTVSRTSTQNGMNATTFEDYNEYGENVPLFTIYYLTGDLREYLVDDEGMEVLYKGTNSIYAASVSQDAYKSEHHMSIDEIKERFSIISQSW